MNKKQKTVFWTALLALILTGPLVSGLRGETSASLERVVNQIDAMFPPLEGYVIAVEGETLTLDVKQGQPVEKGDLLELIRYGEDLMHPVSKKKIGRKETDLGVVEIIDVRRDFSLAKVIDPSVEAKAGDAVRSPFSKLSFVITPFQVKTKKKIDVDRLQLDFENQLNQRHRFQVPAFELGLWMLENGLNTKSILRPENLERLKERVQADYIIVPSIRSVKNKMALGYKLYSTLDGTLEQQAKVLSDQLPMVRKSPARRKKGPREQEVQTSFGRKEEALLKYIGKQEFSFELVDFDIGDINGDGQKEFILIDRYRVMIYDYRDNKFKKIGQIKTNQNANHFLAVDVGDINGNGRDEIFVTNQRDNQLSSFALEANAGSMKPRNIWNSVNSYFRIIHPFGSKPTLHSQNPGVNGPFHGPIKKIIYRNGNYVEGPQLDLPPISGEELIVYGLTQADVNFSGKKDTIILDNNYHLRVYSPSGRLLIKSNDYYGHDPRQIDVGVTVDIAGIVEQGEPVHFKGRLEFVLNGEERFLLLPKNHRLGGSLLSRVVVVENSSLVVLGLSKEGFERLYETKKQRGYLAAFQVMSFPSTKETKVHVATVEEGGLGGKTVSSIFTYDWPG